MHQCCKPTCQPVHHGRFALRQVRQKRPANSPMHRTSTLCLGTPRAHPARSPRALTPVRSPRATVRARPRRLRAFTSTSMVNRVCMALLCGRGVCLTAKNGAFWPGQSPPRRRRPRIPTSSPPVRPARVCSRTLSVFHGEIFYSLWHCSMGAQDALEPKRRFSARTVPHLDPAFAKL